jgi:hypothetical protein
MWMTDITGVYRRYIGDVFMYSWRNEENRGSPCSYIILGMKKARWWTQFRDLVTPIDMIIMKVIM